MENNENSNNNQYYNDNTNTVEFIEPVNTTSDAEIISNNSVNNNSTSNNYSEPSYTPQQTKKKGNPFRRALSYIAVGLICTIIGGAASGAAMLYILPKTDIFKNSDFYKNVESSAATSTKAAAVYGISYRAAHRFPRPFLMRSSLLAYPFCKGTGRQRPASFPQTVPKITRLVPSAYPSTA
jgi:hypothetical protein